MNSLKSKLLDDASLTHAFTCKNSGNLAFHVGDKEERVIINHQNLAHNLSYSHETLIHMKQIHSTKVLHVNSTHDFHHPPTCDAIITDKIETPLMVMVADCTPILLYDATSHAIAAIHAGRAGAFGNIINSTITLMKEKFQTKCDTLIAVLGPSICQKCYEVNKEIYNKARDLGYQNSVLKKADRYFLHVNQILEKQLLECGVKKKHIEVIWHCTSCENNKLFSYRADGTATGRQAGVIMLTKGS
jgi:YfiH family protein